MPDWYFSVYLVSLPIGAIITAALAAYAWKHREAPGATSFSFVMLELSFWSIAAMQQQRCITPEQTIIWQKLGYLAVVFVPVTWMHMALGYTGRQSWLQKTYRKIVFWAVPCLQILVIWTNEAHRLFWANQHFIDRTTTWDVSLTPGPAYWGVLTYSYALIISGSIIIVWGAVRAFKLYRQQAVWMIVGALAPLVLNAIENFSVIDYPGDPTLLGLTLCGIAMAIGLFRSRIFDVVPVARDALVESMNDGMLVLDAQNRLVDINPAAENLIGVSASEVIGVHAAKALRKWPQMIAQFGDSMHARVEISLNIQGQQHYYDLRISPLCDRNQQVTGRLIVVHDITERKHAEEALRQYASELEISNAELDAFAHSVAHDLKTPLSSLVGFSTLMEQRHTTMEPKRIEENLHIITRSGLKMASIINELLLLASTRRMEDIEKEPLNMYAILHEAQTRLADMIKESQAILHIPDQWPIALGYAPWIEEVWVNYLSNAIKYGGEPPKIELGYDSIAPAPLENQDVDEKISRPDAHPMCLRFWVRDNGTGIPQDMHIKLFVEFSRLERTRAHGHGLGLSIVRRIVEKLGGQVGVESASGQGSLFYFTLPSAQNEPRARG